MSADQQDLGSRLRVEAWTRAVHAAGTAKIFDIRARRFNRRLRGLSFAGLVLPLAVGLIVLAYGVGLGGLSIILWIAAGFSAAQLVVALWAVVQGWADTYDGATRSFLANEALAQRFEDLGRNPPTQPDVLRNELDLVIARDDAQRQHDNAQKIGDRELRMGMRAALLRFGRACAKCHEVPNSMKPTDCGVCGDF